MPQHVGNKRTIIACNNQRCPPSYYMNYTKHSAATEPYATREKPVTRLSSTRPQLRLECMNLCPPPLKPCRSMGNGGIQIGHLDTDIFPIQIVHTRVIQDWSIL